jgi:hypothetical protein
MAIAVAPVKPYKVFADVIDAAKPGRRHQLRFDLAAASAISFTLVQRAGGFKLVHPVQGRRADGLRHQLVPRSAGNRLGRVVRAAREGGKLRPRGHGDKRSGACPVCRTGRKVSRVSPHSPGGAYSAAGTPDHHRRLNAEFAKIMKEPG